MTEIESSAAEKTRSFYIHVFLPWAKENHFATDPYQWYLATRQTPGEDPLLRDELRKRESTGSTLSVAMTKSRKRLGARKRETMDAKADATGGVETGTGVAMGT